MYFLIFLISCIINLVFGATSLDFFSFFHGKIDEISFQILSFRFVHMLEVIFVGACLSLCGNVLQKILRNPLADPFVLGISAGGTFFSASFVLLGLSSYSLYFSKISSFFPIQSVFSFLGCVVSFLFLLFGKKRVPHFEDEYVFVLLGVILNAVFSSTLMLLIALADPSELSQIHGWLIGSIQPISFIQVSALFFIAIFPLFFILKQSNRMNLLIFGDDFAASAGIKPEQLRNRLVFAICALIALAVSISGAIGFLGLIVPHFVKRVHHVSVLKENILCLVSGGILLLIADVMSRSLLAPAEIPIGVFTALFGAPAFCFFLFQRKNLIT